MAQKTGSDVMWFVYDSDGTRIGFTYNGEVYHYTTNAQGDVTGITDVDDNLVVEYSYDAWGKLLSTTGSMADTIGQKNPFLYRGYYYDTETGLYYVNSRYYDAEIGRWINADAPEILGLSATHILGANLFAYCYNNPVNYSDPTGHLAIVDDLAFLGIAICAVAVGSALTAYMSTTQFQQSWRSFYGAIGSGLSWLFQSSTTVVTKAVERNIAKARDVIRTKQNQDYYWIASKVTFSKKGVSKTTYFPCVPITAAAAAAYVRTGGDVFASSQAAARRLAIAINGGTPVGPEIHGGVGYFWHYHARSHIGGHIFYL